MVKRGRKKISQRIQEMREFKKKRKRASYSPGDDYPTVEEAKNLIKECYESRGFKIRSIQNRIDGFLVTFKERNEYWEGTKKRKCKGPYGLGRMKISWYLVKKLKNEGE